MSEQIQSEQSNASAPAVASGELLAALRENAEKHRALLKRLIDDPYRRDDVVRLEARASAVFDLLEIITAAERQCAAIEKLDALLKTQND